MTGMPGWYPWAATVRDLYRQNRLLGMRAVDAHREARVSAARMFGPVRLRARKVIDLDAERRLREKRRKLTERGRENWNRYIERERQRYERATRPQVDDE